MNFKKNVVLKKSRKWFFDVFRKRNADENRKVIILNSIPKSGTHLLHQVLAPLSFKDFGGFIASTPSFTMKERSDDSLVKEIEKVYSKELMSAHMFYSSCLEEKILESKACMIFIYRDPRDIFLSEINYLSNMNKFHKLNNYYKKCKNFNEKFDLCLNGINTEDFYYPCFSERIEKYIGWLDSDSCIAVSFENLRNSESIEHELFRIGEHLTQRLLWDSDIENFVSASKKSINPVASHTFSGGKVGRWKRELDIQQINLLNKHLDRQLQIMGFS